MPSDLADVAAPAGDSTPSVEPPSAKLIVRLFLIPLLIVAAAVGVMMLIGRMAGGPISAEKALERLKNSGGGRTADVLVGPASKQRYMDAKALVDHMKQGLSEGQRIELTDQLIDILDNHTSDNEGEVREVLLLALGRAWQIDPRHPTTDSAESLAARQRALQALLKYADAPELAARKAAVLATVYWKGRAEAKQIIPKLIARLASPSEDLDVRMAAATVLGPLASGDDRDAIAALQSATRNTDEKEVELVWDASLSLAQLNQPEVADTILKLLSRQELKELRYFDRESDPKNPVLRKLSEQEQQRILINTMSGARHLEVPAVQDKLRDLARNDPSPRVRAAGEEILKGEGTIE
jgi:thioredoxin-like negative regulator of GroEL